MTEYFVINEGREEGPFSVGALGKFLNPDLLHRGLSCREAGSVRPLSRQELLRVLATAHAPRADVSLEFPIAFESFTRPAGNPFRFRGKGNVGILRDMVGLEGKRSPPFWFSRWDTVTIPFSDILNVARAGNVVSFESDAHPPKFGRRVQSIRLIFEDEASAAAFINALPERLSHGEGIERVARAEFNAHLAQRSWSFVVPLIVAINILMYILIGMSGAGWMTANPQKLIEWGSNFGPLTTGGEWWRLLSAAFLHGGLVHLLVNMAVLFDTGRLCERLYGRGNFLLLYLLCGLCGSAVSVWWNPLVNSVGASGAIFGVFGALLVFMLDGRNGVPASIMKRHQATTLVFIAYVLFDGFGKAGIDNAAHLGGLAGGVILGWAFARPIDVNVYTSKSRRWPAAGTAAIALAVFALLAATPNTKRSYELQQRFMSDLTWFRAEEKKLTVETKDFLDRAATSNAKPAAQQSEVIKLAAGWGRAHARFAAYRVEPFGSAKDMPELQENLVLYLELRRRALDSLASALGSPSLGKGNPDLQEFARLWKESGVVLQRLNDKAQSTKEKSGG